MSHSEIDLLREQLRSALAEGEARAVYVSELEQTLARLREQKPAARVVRFHGGHVSITADPRLFLEWTDGMPLYASPIPAEQVPGEKP